jgi:Cu2+-containing amine oxidase
VSKDDKETHWQKKEEKKLLDDQILTSNNYDFSVFWFVFKKEI